MLRKKNSKILLSFIILCLSCVSIDVNKNKIDQNELNLMIGQMLMVGFRGLDLSDDSPIIHDIKYSNLGGVVLFDYDCILKDYNRNIKSPDQVKKLINTLKANASTPLFIAIDQEGGRVNRLKTKYGFPETYSAQYLGNLNDIAKTEEEAKKIGITLKELGININFAPVVDININPESPAIGKIERSFSSNPDVVIANSIAYIHGLHEYSVLSCLKHFPGHGSAKMDSHLGITDITKTWKAFELNPYIEIIKSGECDMIMTGHLYNSHLDFWYPATLSGKIINDILRKKIGYDGVIISDDMQMRAITNFYGLNQTIYLALKSGVDILLFANNLVYDKNIAIKAKIIITSLVDSNKISYSQIKDSYDRISKLKSKLNELKNYTDDVPH